MVKEKEKIKQYLLDNLGVYYDEDSCAGDEEYKGWTIDFNCEDEEEIETALYMLFGDENVVEDIAEEIGYGDQYPYSSLTFYFTRESKANEWIEKVKDRIREA